MLIFFLLVSFGVTADESTEKPPNVLFIMIDDLRTELGSFGSKHAISPNIDKLAQQGTSFTNAYVSVPVCGASRASMLTGMRSTRDRFKNYYTSVEKDAPNVVTLFEQFKNNGYQTSGYGKIFHVIKDTEKQSWSSGHAWIPEIDHTMNSVNLNSHHSRDYQSPANIAEYRATKRGPSTEMVDVPDDAYFDGKLANKATQKLTKLSKSGQPFFLAVGFVKPHLPYTAPKKYWDMYNPKQFYVPEHSLPKNAPQKAYHRFGELRAYSDTPPAPEHVGTEQAIRLIHGYHAAVSYADAQVGKVLAKLDELGLSENTIVVLVGDHGYSLGEHGLWCKHSTFDVATKAPLIIRAPNSKGNQVVTGLVEFIDIFPTLTELADIPAPEQAAGQSLLPLLNDPSLPAKSAVFPRYHAAEAIRTDRYSLTQWFDKKGTLQAQMLYDHQKDPKETINLTDAPEYKKVLVDLSKQLKIHIKTRK
ncbi:MAG: sulfatase [Alteromonadales bacterium]|nr:sulfatase [Alteromonadales bacterium]